MRSYFLIFFLFTVISVFSQNTPTRDSTLPSEDAWVDMVIKQGTFPGGMDSLKSFINVHLKEYLSDTLLTQIKGSKFIIKVIIEKDGTSSEHSIIRKTYSSLISENSTLKIEEALLNVFRAMPPWKPTETTHGPIRQTMIIPVLI